MRMYYFHKMYVLVRFCELRDNIIQSWPFPFVYFEFRNVTDFIFIYIAAVLLTSLPIARHYFVADNRVYFSLYTSCHKIFKYGWNIRIKKPSSKIKVKRNRSYNIEIVISSQKANSLFYIYRSHIDVGSFSEKDIRPLPSKSHRQ